MKKEKLITIIKRSCTTGRAVWIYRGASKGAARQAYMVAKRKEQSRVRWWKNKLKRRAAHIRQFLDRLIESLPMMGDIPPEQQEAIRELQRIADAPVACDTDFHNHTRTEQRRRKKEQKKNFQNANYDK